MPMSININHSVVIYNYLKQLGICKFITDTHTKHLVSIIHSAFSKGYHGKTIDFAAASNCHRTTVAHFLNHGKWDSEGCRTVLKYNAVQDVYNESRRSSAPVYCVVDDTIASHTKPSSQALHPIEAAYFHQSHLKSCQDYGHQAVAVLLACNDVVRIYDVVMYDKTQTKIQIVQNIANELPIPPVASYYLCDSWYTTQTVIDTFLMKGFYTIGALKVNRIIYPCRRHISIRDFAEYIHVEDKEVHLVTVRNRQFYVYRYDGKLNGIPDASVILSYPKEAFGNEKALRAFISTDTSLSTQEILDRYCKRWPIELFFRESKNKLAWDKYQIRSKLGISRYWMILCLVYNMCRSYSGVSRTFTEGYHYIEEILKVERNTNIYHLVRSSRDLSAFLECVG